MPSPMSVKKNSGKKRSDIYTPAPLANFLYDILHPVTFEVSNAARRNFFVLDPAIGSGRLTDPWYNAGCNVHGIDTVDSKAKCNLFTLGRYEDCSQLGGFNLVLMNPPFNQGAGRKLYPQVFLQKTFELLGPKVPVAMITPMGFRLNQRKHSTRWPWVRDCGAEITSIVSLPLDIFPEVLFHCEVLIFNRPDLKPHYFLPNEAL